MAKFPRGLGSDEQRWTKFKFEATFELDFTRSAQERALNPHSKANEKLLIYRLTQKKWIKAPEICLFTCDAQRWLSCAAIFWPAAIFRRVNHPLNPLLPYVFILSNLLLFFLIFCLRVNFSFESASLLADVLCFGCLQHPLPLQLWIFFHFHRPWNIGDESEVKKSGSHSGPQMLSLSLCKC